MKPNLQPGEGHEVYASGAGEARLTLRAFGVGQASKASEDVEEAAELSKRKGILGKRLDEKAKEDAERFQSTSTSKPASPSRETFPRIWELFPIILPRSVKEQVYEPCVEELKEDYLRERGRWKGRFSRRWVTFCFTVRTGILFTQSLWAATRGAMRKGLLAALAMLFGDGVVAMLRERLAAWFGRLL